MIGSLPRPQFVKDLIADDCPIAGDEYRRLMGDAIRAAVALQETAGLDVITDGEWWRKSYIGVIAELAHGFELSTNPADGRPWTVVVDKLSPKQPGFIAQEIKFLKQLTKRRLKATVPAPALLGERMWDPVKSAKAYPKREDFVRDCVPILRREVELLRDEGVSIIQVDDPAPVPVRRSARSAANTTMPSGPPTSPSTWTTRSSTASKASSWPCTSAAVPAPGRAAKPIIAAVTIRF